MAAATAPSALTQSQSSQSTTTAPTNPSTTTPAPAPSKPPLTIPPTAYLDPASYVLGTHPINISPSTLIHPRARLISSHCPLSIGEGCIITERCIVGGPAPTTSTSTTAPTPPIPATTTTTLGTKVHLHSSSTVQHGATIGSYTIIEPHAEVLAGIHVGEHSKICAGTVVDKDLGDWEVVFTVGNGQQPQRRKRKEDGEVEAARLRGLDGERVGTLTVLRAAQLLAQSKATAKRGK